MKLQDYKNLPANERRENRKPRLQEEHNHQAAYFRILKLNERRFPELAFIFAVPNAAKRSPQLGMWMVKEGLVAGVPDIIIPMARRGYHGAFLETKFGNNKMSPAQIKFRDFLSKENYFVLACYDERKLTTITEWFLSVELEK